MCDAVEGRSGPACGIRPGPGCGLCRPAHSRDHAKEWGLGPDGFLDGLLGGTLGQSRGKDDIRHSLGRVAKDGRHNTCLHSLPWVAQVILSLSMEELTALIGRARVSQETK
jgi:hypothetical protein